MYNQIPLFAPQFEGSFPPPRPWQDAAHEALREGARNGHRCQLLMAPTGSGKTYQAMRIIHEALLKHKRAMFVCDRKTLINQTSSVASDYGLHTHGIIQAQNPKMDPRKHFQIGSLQTLAMRGWPDTDVVIIDEAHTQYKTWRDYIKNHPETRVIGLSATPFSVGLGRLFTNLVNVTTMDALTKEGILVPLRIYTCHRPDMRGAATQGGEWTDAAAAERELAIVGDVVSEWTKLAEGRKSICFGATIAHCEEIARRFNEAGIRAATFTAKTTEDERREILAEFGDRPGEIHILVSVEALAKGFDVKDVGCILDCRPLRKSLSTAIQMWGRGLRSSPETGKLDCIARGSLVLTNAGLIPIERVQLWHKLWDGQEWVSHGGAICKGTRKVITYAGLTATPDHRVKTEAGWRTLGDCAREQIRIVQTGFGGGAVWESENRFASHYLARPEAPNAQACNLRLCDLRDAEGFISTHARAWSCQWLQDMREPEDCPIVALQPVPRDAPSVFEPQRQEVGGLRREGDTVLFYGPNSLRFVDYREPRYTGKSSGHGTRQDKQQRKLRTREYPVGVTEDEHFEHSQLDSYCEDAPIHVPKPRMQLRRINTEGSDRKRVLIRGHHGPVAGSVLQAEREVWDILDAGPRHCFTVSNVLAHNCILLDFSGNIIRFSDDFADVYFNGLSHLDQGEKLDKTIRKDEEKGIRKCPQCGFQPVGKTCIMCGYQAKRTNLVQHQAGTMEAFAIGQKVYAESKADLYAQLAAYAKIHSLPERVKGRTAHLYKDFVGVWPPNGWDPYTVPEVRPSRETMNKIRSLTIAFSKRRTA